MAVIDTSMDLPMSCTKCPYADIMDEFAHSWCNKLKNRYFITTDYTDKRLDECPLKEVPSGKWISVDERLPKPYMFVNATCRSLVDDRENWVVETIYLPIPKEHNPRQYSDWGNIPMLNCGDAEVIAWMERIIPEPYKMVK